MVLIFFLIAAQTGLQVTTPSSAFCHSSSAAGAYSSSSGQSAQAGFLSQFIYPKGQQRGERFICTFAIGRFESRQALG
jgi:hypothetical protein